MNKRTAAGSRMAWRGCALIVALAMVALNGEKTPTLASHNPYYKILNLRTFHVSSFCSEEECESHAFDVNIWGQVTGWSRLGPYDPNTPFIRAFRTAPNAPIDVFSPLPLLHWCIWSHCDPNYLSYRVNFGNALNDSGWTVGTDCGFGNFNRLCDPVRLAFLAIGGPTQQLAPPNEGPGSRATGINNLGTIVGFGLPGAIGHPEDINDSGIVVGEKSGHAYRWTGGPSVQELGTLNPDCDDCWSTAYAVNDAGFIVGASNLLQGESLGWLDWWGTSPGDPWYTPAGIRHAFIWPSLVTLAMVDLGTLCTGLFSGFCSSVASDINIHNHVVGTSSTTTLGEGNPHAFLFKGLTMTDINTLLSPTDQAAWILTEATAINDLGQIVGTGLFQHHKPRAYLLTPPLHVIFTNVKDLSSLFLVDLASERMSLGAKMDAAEAAVERGDLEDARQQLDEYEREVQALLQSRRLGQIQATKLFAGVGLIRHEIEER